MAEFQTVMKEKERMCNNYKLCYYCPLCKLSISYMLECEQLIVYHYDEVEDIIMKWVKENPVQTNADKFKEVFGLEVIDIRCPLYWTDFCQKVEYCIECKYKEFWKQEYKKPNK